MTTINQGIASLFGGFYKLRRKLLLDFQASCSGECSHLSYIRVEWENALGISCLSLKSLFLLPSSFPSLTPFPESLVGFIGFFSLLYMTYSSPNSLSPLEGKNT